MAAKKEEKVIVTLPLSEDPNAPKDEYFSLNFKGYRIKKGVPVKVPAELAEVIKEAERGRNAAIQYASEVALKEPK